MKAKYSVGQTLYCLRYFDFMGLPVGTEVRVIEVLEDKGQQPRYAVKQGAAPYLWAFEEDLGPTDPIREESDFPHAEGFCDYSSEESPD